MRKMTESDKIACDNLIKLLRKVKVELEGMEILATAQVYDWVGKISKDISEDLKPAIVPVSTPETEVLAKQEEPKDPEDPEDPSKAAPKAIKLKNKNGK
jgi:hypothetical protein